MNLKRFVSVTLAVAVLFAGLVPAGVAAADGDDVSTDCQFHIPEDPDCDGDMEQPDPDEYDDQPGEDAGGLIDAIIGIIGGLF